MLNVYLFSCCVLMSFSPFQSTPSGPRANPQRPTTTSAPSHWGRQSMPSHQLTANGPHTFAAAGSGSGPGVGLATAFGQQYRPHAQQQAPRAPQYQQQAPHARAPQYQQQVPQTQSRAPLLQAPQFSSRAPPTPQTPQFQQSFTPPGMAQNHLLPQQLPQQRQPQQQQQNVFSEMVKKPIIIYSQQCQHSNVFLEGLRKHPTLFKNFVKINIDATRNPRTNKMERPAIFYDLQKFLNHRINKVPTIIVDKGEYILTDKEAFKWLEFNIIKDKSKIDGFNQAEMNAFSDKYADFGSTPINMMDDQHVKHQRFVFIDEELDKMQTPSDDALYMRSEGSVGGQRTQIDNQIAGQQRNMGNLDLSDQYSQQAASQDDLKRLEQSRGYHDQPGPKTTIDFSDPNFGYSGVAQNNGRASIKEAELTDRFEQMRMQRESLGAFSNQQTIEPPKGLQVDFQSGQVYYKQ